MKKIRVAIVGTGYIGDFHARAILNAGGAEITVACARTRESAGAFAKRYEIPHATTRALSIAGRDDVDAVVIGTPNKFHAPYALAMLEAKKHVLLEKPMAMNAKEAAAVARAARRYKRTVLVGHMWRFDAEVNYIRGAVKEGLIGDVVRTKGYGIHENWGPSGWFVKKKLAGGGALADMGVHAIDTARYIMGDPAPKMVYASIGTHYGDYDVDDTGVIMITWANGAVSVVESGWWQPHMDGPEAGTGIFGTKGYAGLFPTQLKISAGGLPGTFKPSLPERSDHCGQAIYDRQMEHFLDCVRRRKKPTPGVDEGLTIMKIVDAAYRSARSGKVVKCSAL